MAVHKARAKKKANKPNGLEVYGIRDVTGVECWFWRLRRNGRIVADGSEWYVKKSNAVRAAKAVHKWLASSKPPALIVHRAVGPS